MVKVIQECVKPAVARTLAGAPATLRFHRTMRASCGGDSRTSSARNVSRAAWQPGSSIVRQANNRRSRSAPCVGHVLASGSSAGEKSRTPLATAYE